MFKNTNLVDLLEFEVAWSPLSGQRFVEEQSVPKLLPLHEWITLNIVTFNEKFLEPIGFETNDGLKQMIV